MMGILNAGSVAHTSPLNAVVWNRSGWPLSFYSSYEKSTTIVVKQVFKLLYENYIKV